MRPQGAAFTLQRNLRIPRFFSTFSNSPFFTVLFHPISQSTNTTVKRHRQRNHEGLALESRNRNPSSYPFPNPTPDISTAPYLTRKVPDSPITARLSLSNQALSLTSYELLNADSTLIVLKLANKKDGSYP